MTEPRDNQRKRLYTAEKALAPLSARIEDIPSIQFFVDKVLARAPIQRRYGRWLGKWKVVVRDGRRCRRALGGIDGVQLPRWSRTQYIVLHEVAHTLAHRKFRYTEIAGHGPEYAGIYLDLIRFGMGQEPHDVLKASFKAHRVKAKVDRRLRFKAEKVKVAPPVKKAARTPDRWQNECAKARVELRRLARELDTGIKVDRSDDYFEMDPCAQFPEGFTTRHYDWVETLRRVRLCIEDPTVEGFDGSGYSE